jgi:hypothetical protein
MTIKETLVSHLQDAGHDFSTSCEVATSIIREVNARPAGTYTYRVGNVEIDIARR